MKPNLWLYSSQEEMMGTGASLIVFGAGVFKRAKVINEFDQLNRIYLDRKNGAAKISDPILQEFIFEYLIDCVRIAIFFENYMKAELIVNGFCVHKIKKEIPKFEPLAEEQRKGPVKVRDIHSIEAFQVNDQTKTIYHNAIKETTLGISELTGTTEYTKHYKFDKTTLDYLKELNQKRNNLHFHESVEFELSDRFLKKIKNLNAFVDLVMNTFIKYNGGKK
jgi:hypothetical protein